MKKGLYIHIPFCIKKCSYCDFASYSDMFGYAAQYTSALIKEMNTYPAYDIDTVYIGGGTPSSIDSYLIRDILNNAFNHFNIEKNCEITIEVNPATVDKKKLDDYINMGINRMSMGVQSFVEDELKLLGRIHTGSDAIDTFNMARECGFSNISLDLMFGLPNQKINDVKMSAEKIVSLESEHISCYGLNLEEGTKMYDKYKNSPLDNDTFADMYEYISDLLVLNGYSHYEISNYSKENMQSEHNTKYWLCGEYVGLGAGASSYIGDVRYTNTRDILNYIKGEKPNIDEVLNKKSKMSEFVILGLRLLKEGINIDEFKLKFGEDIYDVFGIHLKKYSDFIRRDANVLKLNKNAYYICNTIFADFI